MTQLGTKGLTGRQALVVACLVLFTDMLVYGLAVPVLPLLPATVSAGPSATSVLFAGYAAATIVVTPLAGRLVDRHGPRRPMGLGAVGLAAATAVFTCGGPYGLLLLARVLQGASAGLSWVAGLSLIAGTTAPHHRPRALGTAMSMVSLGVLAGPPAAGLLAGWGGARLPFVVAATLALVDVAVVLVLSRRPADRSGETVGPLAVLRVPGSIGVIACIVVAAGSLAAIEPVLPGRLAIGYGFSPLLIGLCFGMVSLIGAALSPALGTLLSNGIRPRVLIGAGLASTVAGLLVIAVTGHAVGIWLGLALIGVANPALMTPATSLIGEQGMRTDPPAIGGAFALFNLAYTGGLLCGPLLSGLGYVAGDFPAAVALPALAFLAVGATGVGHLVKRSLG